MKIVHLGLFGLAMFSCGFQASAREASLLSFDGVSSPELASSAPKPSLNVDAALQAQWTVLDSPESRKSSQIPRLLVGRQWHDGGAPTTLQDFSDAALSQACQAARYWPTWWLPPEIEIRRAAHFSNMASVACEFSIPVDLLDAVIAQESGYKPWAISRAGAMGMMQIMPGTARQLGLTSPWEPYANMQAGARYLRQQLNRFGRVDLALAAYNAGPERRSLAAGYVPAIPETLNYVRTITTNWVRLTQFESSGSEALTRAAAASQAIRASGYREVSLTFYDGTNAANPI